MASPQISQALKELASSSDKPQAYAQLLSTAHTASSSSSSSFSSSQLVADYTAILDAIFADGIGIVATRSLMGSLIEALGAIANKDALIAIGQHALDIFSSQASSFEEAIATIRERLATAHEADEEWLAAARMLAGIPLDSSQRQVSNAERVRTWIRITRNYLEEDDTALAEQYLHRAKNVLYTVDDAELTLHFRLSQARIQDARRDFLDAATGYQDISFTPVIAESERLHTLQMAIKCAVLAPAGPARSRVLGRLYKDERVAALDEYSILEKMFLERLLRPDEIAKFARTLAPHQLARTADGATVLERAVVEHNLRAASRLYENIRFDALALLLGLAEDRAEETTARMIEQGRLVGRIDQVEQMIWFEGGEATGRTGSGRTDGVVAREIKRWDGNVQGIAEEVEKVTSELQQLHPTFVAEHLKLAA